MKKTKEIKNNQNGITMVSLLIIVIIMGIIISITIATSLDRFELNKIQQMYNDIHLLSDKVSNYYLQYNGLPILRNEQGEAIEYMHTSLDFDKNSNDNATYYIIDLQAMQGIALNFGKEGYENPNTSDDVYIINEASHIIYYVKGIEIDGVIYHTTPNDNETNTLLSTTTSKPEIKLVEGEIRENGVYIADLKLEFIPGKDNTNGVDRTTYSINSGAEVDLTTLENNMYSITNGGNYQIKVRTYNEVGSYAENSIDMTVWKKRDLTAQSTNSKILEIPTANEMVIKNVKIYGESVQRDFIENYQQVDSLEFDGDSYIDTGYTPNNNTKTETKITGYQTSRFIYDSTHSLLSASNYSAYFTVTEIGNYRFGNNDVEFALTKNTVYTIVQDKTGVDINGTFKAYKKNTEFTSTETLKLGGDSISFKGLIYKFKIWDNNVLVRNFIPCYRKSDNVPGMYDVVTNTFYTNQGRGTFGIGKEEQEIKSLGNFITDTTSENYEKYQIPIKITKTSEENTTTNLIFNEPIRKVGDIADRIDFATGKIIRNIKKENINGTETWNDNTANRPDSAPNMTIRFFALSEMPKNNSALSNQYDFLHALWNYNSQDKFWNICTLSQRGLISVNNTIVGITSSDSTSTRTTKVQDYVKLHNFYVLYPLETPTEKNMTLPTLSSFEDCSKIEVLTDVTPSKIEMEYTAYTLN